MLDIDAPVGVLHNLHFPVTRVSFPLTVESHPASSNIASSSKLGYFDDSMFTNSVLRFFHRLFAPLVAALDTSVPEGVDCTAVESEDPEEAVRTAAGLDAREIAVAKRACTARPSRTGRGATRLSQMPGAS